MHRGAVEVIKEAFAEHAADTMRLALGALQGITRIADGGHQCVAF